MGQSEVGRTVLSPAATKPHIALQSIDAAKSVLAHSHCLDGPTNYENIDHPSWLALSHKPCVWSKETQTKREGNIANVALLSATIV
jgi:hypothetical protein